MEKLHKSLMTWATEEMRFQTTAYSSSSFTRLPLESDFEQLCQRPLDDVWKYVVKHVRSKQTVKEIKGNIELNRKLGGQKSSSDQQKLIATSAGENKLQQEKAALARELASCVSDVNHLLKEIKHITNEVMDAELAYQSVGQRVQDLQKKESILEVVNKCAEEKVAKYSV
uniref:Uncharacterized protein n=1 Tax=Arion vulgaris TaxID=1028688 RepID=A0A0B7ALB5_9EUPU